ncbi:hypothetical protein SELMODRAFT_448455 [Selaginella moellendorffii]|uniref:Uncharacterized protein n=1 Tax=Selaginella moellendorffii TaxID=88036 RepID=D8T7G5_SELML|nr:uncharacterized protein LOC9639615 [Selaginella moellendorffii]EFJ07458.1 hypothetical protein SELMODRAFT_448455 [Selaginella moellendorffii]|eukprot:XP_024521061.1 uncharacterized protein LOC9639615 [Selaginella moellendorffii]
MAAAAEHRRRTLFSDSASSSSLEKLIQESTESEGSSISLSARSSHGSSSADDLDTADLRRRGSVVSSSWSFEGERDCGERRRGKNATNRKSKKDILGEIDGDDAEHSNVGRCVAGCAADCTALCCCPLTLFHVVALLVVKVPSTIAAKISRSWKGKKKKAKNRCSPQRKLVLRGESESSTSRIPAAASMPSSPPHLSPSSSPLPPPPSIQGFGQHFWREFGSGHSSFASP